MTGFAVSVYALRRPPSLDPIPLRPGAPPGVPAPERPGVPAPEPPGGGAPRSGAPWSGAPGSGAAGPGVLGPASVAALGAVTEVAALRLAALAAAAGALVRLAGLAADRYERCDDEAADRIRAASTRCGSW